MAFKVIISGITGVAKEAGAHLLDPSGQKRGTIAYTKLIDSFNPALAAEVLKYERNTRFWVEHDAMLKRTKRSSTNWREAKLDNELDILTENYKDSEVRFDRAEEEKKLRASPKWQARMDIYENLMKKGAKYELTIEDLSKDKAVERNKAKHIGPIEARMETLGKEAYNSFGIGGDAKAIFGHMGIGEGDKRDLISTRLGNSNYSALLPEANDKYAQKNIDATVSIIEGTAINDLDFTRLREAQEQGQVNPRLYERDPDNITEMFSHAETAQDLTGWYAVDKGTKDSLAPKVSVDNELTLDGENYQIADVLHTFYNQSNNNDITTGGNAYIDLYTDHQQLSALIANIGSDPKNGINITRDAGEINLLAWNIVKENISHKSGDISDYAMGRFKTGYLDYNSFTDAQKLQLATDMIIILEELGGDSTDINAARKRITRRVSQAYKVDSVNIMNTFEERLKNSLPFQNIEELELAKQAIVEAYPTLSELEHDVMRNALDKKYERDSNSLLLVADIQKEIEIEKAIEKGMTAEETAEEKFPEELPPNTLKNLEGIVNPKIIPLLSKAKETYDKAAAEVIAEEKFPEELPPLTLKDLEGTVNPNIISLLSKAGDVLTGSAKERKDEEGIKKLTVAADLNNKINKDKKTWDVASVGIENVDAAFNNVFLNLLAEMESDTRNVGQGQRKSTASGYYQMTKAAVQEAIKDIPNIEELHPEVIKSLNKPWIKGQNNLRNISKSTQAKLALAYLFNLQVLNEAGRGDRYMKDFTEAYLENNYSKMADTWKKFYGEGWHTLNKKTKKLPQNVSDRLEEKTKEFFDKYIGI